MSELMLSTSDYFLLQGLILPSGSEGELLRPLLRRKLHQAVVAFPEDIAPDFVMIGSTVRFRIAGGSEERVLVAGGTEASRPMELALASLLGLTLIGARAGQALTVPSIDGDNQTLWLEAVAPPRPLAPTVEVQVAGDAVVPFRPRRAAAVPQPMFGGGDDDPGPSAA